MAKESKAEKQQTAPEASGGTPAQEAAVKVRILKTGTEINGWRFGAGATVQVTATQAAALVADKVAVRVY